MKEERDGWRREGRAGMGLEGTEGEGRGQYEKGGLKKERTSRDHRASELLYSSRVNAIYA